MARPWRNDDQQLTYEAQLPDRFEDGASWIDLAERARALPSVRRYTAREWESLTGQALDVPGSTALAAGLYTLRPEYEAARLRGQYLTVAGRGAVQAALDRAALAIRGARDPETVIQHTTAITLLQQALLDPDRRLPFSRLIATLNLQPRTTTSAPRRR